VGLGSGGLGGGGGGVERGNWAGGDTGTTRIPAGTDPARSLVRGRAPPPSGTWGAGVRPRVAVAVPVRAGPRCFGVLGSPGPGVSLGKATTSPVASWPCPLRRALGVP
jgi:hypothetical protein